MSEGPIPLSQAIRIRLTETVGPVFYSDFAAHLARDAVFVVGPTLSIIECGVAIALDDVEVVGGWIQRGELKKPTQGERDTWPNDKNRRWTSLVVMPFVLLQDLPD